MKNAVVDFKDGNDSAREADVEIMNFKKENIVYSSICDGLSLKEINSQISIKSSCLGRKVKIGKNV